MIRKVPENLMIEKGAMRILGVWDTKMTNGSAVRPHHHTDVEEVFYILEGSGVMIIGSEERNVSEGDLVYVPPLQIHTISHKGRKPLRFITMSIYIGAAEKGGSRLRYIG